MAGEHPNAGRVRGLFKAFEERDLEAIAGAFADDKAVELREFVWDLYHVDDFWS